MPELALRGPTSKSFARVTVASVGKNLLSVGMKLFQQWQELHLASEDRCAAAEGGENCGL